MKRTTNFLAYSLLIMGIALLLNSCKEDETYSLPTVTTTKVTAITPTTATTGGEITSNGGAMITARGVCWSTSQNPTISNNKTTDSNDKDSFASTMTKLSPATTYYVRAYATNSAGTSYGNEFSFKTLIADGTTGTLEYNGHTYKTVYINGKEWLAENLRTTTYNDSKPILHRASNNDWLATDSGAYCSYNKESTYGFLYNWYAVKTGKLAPNGWHIPTDKEWTALTDYLGGKNIAGGKLKETGTTHWESPNTNATDETGFKALPGGFRTYSSGSFTYVGMYAYFWTASSGGREGGWARKVKYSDGEINRFNNNSNKDGFSVRCVRD